MLKLLYNYYMVLRACWLILAFQVIGYLALVEFEQARDIIGNLSVVGDPIKKIHFLFSSMALFWWSWQCWRSARTELHFTDIKFIRKNSILSLRAQVLIPRLLGVIPFLLMALAVYKAKGWDNPTIYFYLNGALLLYIFFHLRRDISTLLKTRKWLKLHNLPDYVVVKNEAYPAAFLWAKQRGWIMFRIFVVFIFFGFSLILPVEFPRFIGAAAIVLFALGSWQILATLIDFAEKHYQFPFSFTLIIMLMVFSYFNNNHGIRTKGESQYVRLQVDEHFSNWYHNRSNGEDTLDVFLLASQGGGVRSAYWTSQILADLELRYPGFDSLVYAYSTVSGASLGVAVYKSLLNAVPRDQLSNKAHEILKQDFLSPVTSWLVSPEVFQKFMPFPISKFDRSKNLERSWELSCEVNGKFPLSNGFLENTHRDPALYMYHSTHAENGKTVLVSNVHVSSTIFRGTEDFFGIIESDVPHSTAISVSARFPFVTPPARITKGGEEWGHLVDGGYADNMGGQNLMRLYSYLREYCELRGLKVRFNLIFIKNLKLDHLTPVRWMHEISVPLVAFNKVWSNTGDFTENSFSLHGMRSSDRVFFIPLTRSNEDLIPLGWYLSDEALVHIRSQVDDKTAELCEYLSTLGRLHVKS